jgi:hypothetical protein
MRRDVVVVGLGVAAAGLLSSDVVRWRQVTLVHDPRDVPATAGLPLLVGRPELQRLVQAAGAPVCGPPETRLVDPADRLVGASLPVGAAVVGADDLDAAIGLLARRSSVEIVEGRVVQIDAKRGVVTLEQDSRDFARIGEARIQAELVVWCGGVSSVVGHDRADGWTAWWRRTAPTESSSLTVTATQTQVWQRLTSRTAGYELVTGARPDGDGWNEAAQPMLLDPGQMGHGRLILTGSAVGCANQLTVMGTTAAFATGLAAGQAASGAATSSASPVEHYTQAVRRVLGASPHRIGPVDRRHALVVRSVAAVSSRSTPVRRRVASVLLGYGDGVADELAEIEVGLWDARVVATRDAARAAVLEVLSRVWAGPVATAVESRGEADPRLSDFALALIGDTQAPTPVLVDLAASMDLVMAGLGLVGPAASGIEQPDSDAQTDWLRVSSVLLMDLVFAEAARHAARVGNWYLELLVGWASDLLRVRLLVLHGEARPLTMYERLLEFPFRVAVASGWNKALDLISLVRLSAGLAAELLAEETRRTQESGLSRLGLWRSEMSDLGLIDDSVLSGGLEEAQRRVNVLVDQAVTASGLTATQRRTVSELRRACREGGVTWS